MHTETASRLQSILVAAAVASAVLAGLLHIAFAAALPDNGGGSAFALTLTHAALTISAGFYIARRLNAAEAPRVKSEQDSARELMKSARRFRSFMNNAPFSALIVDGERLVYANPIGLANRTRIGPLNGDRFYEGLPPAYTAEVLAENRRAITERRAILKTRALADADGGIRHWHTVRFPVDDEDEGRTFTGMYAIDVTEVHQALEEKAFAQKQLLQSYKMAALGEMSGGIAHEINNPISIIIGKGRQLQEILASEPFDAAEARQFAEAMVVTARRVVSIVHGLRAISRQAERDPCQLVAVSSLVEGTIAIVVARFRDAGVELMVGDIDPALQLECRPSELSQVLTNLLSNALDAVESHSEKWVRLTLESAADKLVFSVEDSGPGIPFELREKIMQPFFTTKGVGKGTGLGLSISRGFIEGHGGTLEMDENSQRTRFMVSVPLRQAATAGQPS